MLDFKGLETLNGLLYVLVAYYESDKLNKSFKQHNLNLKPYLCQQRQACHLNYLPYD